MKRDYLEEDMYGVLRDHFTELGYRVNGEVKDCDVTAVRGDTLIVLELKKSLSLELLIQAVKRQKLSDLTYLCVPKPKNYKKNRKHSELLHLLKRLSLGLIYCDPEQNALEIILQPQEFDLARSKKLNRGRREELLREIQGRRTSLNQGGSRGKTLMTAYREDAIRLLWLGEELGGTLAPRDGSRLGINKAPAILRDNYYGWFEKVSRGRYSLTQRGREALASYQPILPEVLKDIRESYAETLALKGQSQLPEPETPKETPAKAKRGKPPTTRKDPEPEPATGE